jgi:hypothetical protein
LFAVGWFYDSRVVSTKAEVESQLTQLLQPIETQNAQMQEAIQKADAVKKQLDQFTQNMEERFYWLNLISELRDALQATETMTDEPGLKTGVWIESFVPVAPDFGAAVSTPGAESTDTSDADSALAARRFYMSDPALRARYGLDRLPASPEATPDAGAATTAKATATNEINTVELTCRAIKIKKSPTSNFELAQTLLNEIRSRTNWFVPEETKFTGEKPSAEDNEPTFTFKMNLKLARPVKL